MTANGNSEGCILAASCNSHPNITMIDVIGHCFSKFYANLMPMEPLNSKFEVLILSGARCKVQTSAMQRVGQVAWMLATAHRSPSALFCSRSKWLCLSILLLRSARMIYGYCPESKRYLHQQAPAGCCQIGSAHISANCLACIRCPAPTCYHNWRASTQLNWNCRLVEEVADSAGCHCYSTSFRPWRCLLTELWVGLEYLR